MIRDYVFIAVAGEDKVLSGKLNADSGQVEIVGECVVPGGPEMLAIDPQRRYLFVGCNPRYYSKNVVFNDNYVYSLKIDWETGQLTPISSISLDLPPVYLEMNNTGRYLLSAYYSKGKAAVHPISDDGVVGEATQWFNSGRGAHSIVIDPSGKYVFLPHIAPSAKNLAKWPPQRDPEHILPNASNTILQFKFDSDSGLLVPNTPFGIVEEHGGGPRHLCFHPTQNIAYFTCEQGNAVAVYSFDPKSGTLTAIQYISTLPEGCTVLNTCSSLRVARSGQFLFVLNRGYDSIVSFQIDSHTGLLGLNGIFPAQAMPREMEISLDDKFLFTAGYKHGIMETYRIEENGGLVLVSTQNIGNSPMWILHACSCHT